MKRLLALLLACSLASSALAQSAPDIVLTDDEELAPSSEDLPAVQIDAEDQPDLAFADASDPNPGSGIGQIVAGWVATGVGVAGVTRATLCKYSEFHRGYSEHRCRNFGIAFGVIGLTLGIPWLVFGYQKRREQRAWKERHGLSELQLSGDSLLLRF